jgi:hypothetical protein
VEDIYCLLFSPLSPALAILQLLGLSPKYANVKRSPQIARNLKSIKEAILLLK